MCIESPKNTDIDTRNIATRGGSVDGARLHAVIRSGAVVTDFDHSIHISNSMGVLFFIHSCDGTDKVYGHLKDMIGVETKLKF
jgi:hypothetical protein